MKLTSILIVEDEVIVARDIANTLESRGYKVTGVAASSKEALQSVEDERPELVLMDVMLKGKQNGIVTAEKIYQKYNIPVVYLTAYADEQTIQKAKLTEPFGYLIKPFEESHLISAIEIALYKHQLDDELKKMNLELENRVRDRTIELEKINEALKAEIIERKKAESEKEKMLIGLNEKMKELTSVSYSASILKSEMLRSHLEHEKMQEARQSLMYALREHMLELSLIRKITDILQDIDKPVDETLGEIVASIPSGLQDPDNIVVRLLYDDIEMKSPEFLETEKKIMADFVTNSGKKGTIEIFHLKDELNSMIENFFWDKKNLLSYLTVLLKNYFDRRSLSIWLNEQLNLLQQLIDNLPNPMFYMDKQGCFLGCNKAFEQFISLPKKEIIGKTLNDVSIQEIADIYHRMDMEMFDRMGVQVYEAGIERSAGKKLHVLINKSIYQDIEGNLAGLLGIITDITERKEMEEAFHKEFNKIVFLIDQLQFPVWYMKDMETFGLVNQSFVNFFGKGKKDIENKNMSFIFPNGVAENLKTKLIEVYSKKRQIDFDETLVNNKGEKVKFQVRMAPKFNDSNEIETILCIAYLK